MNRVWVLVVAICFKGCVGLLAQEGQLFVSGDTVQQIDKSELKNKFSIGRLGGYVDVMGQVATYQRTGAYMHYAIQGAVGLKGGALPLFLRWSIRPGNTEVFPAAMSIEFDRDEFEGWVSKKAIETIQKQGVEYMSLEIMEQRIRALEGALSRVDINSLELKLKNLENKGDTLSEEYKQLKQAIDRYYKYQQMLQEYRTNYNNMLQFYQQYQQIYSSYDEAMSYLEKARKITGLMKALNGLREFQLGRFSWGALTEPSRPVVLTGLNMEIERNRWILGINGGFGENILLTRDVYRSYWVIGATVGRHLFSGATIISRYNYVHSREEQGRQHSVDLQLRGLSLLPNRVVVVGGGIKKVWAKVPLQFDSSYLNEGSFQSAISMWRSNGSSYWANINKNGKMWTFKIKGTYYDKGYKDYTIPYDVAGMGDIQMEHKFRFRSKSVDWEAGAMLEQGFQFISYMWTLNPAVVRKYGANLGVGVGEHKFKLRGYRIEPLLGEGHPTYHINSSISSRVKNVSLIGLCLFQWKANKYRIMQYIGIVTWRYRRLAMQSQASWTRTDLGEFGLKDKYKGRVIVRFPGEKFRPYVGASGYRHVQEGLTRAMGDAGFTWHISKTLITRLALGAGYEWDVLYGDGVVGQLTAQIRVQW
ncbi:MAG: hypothetical protein GXO48_07055 [Chlorobi bacterium]|nr:hypothetical protein [Chlorobiota bacterium]